jgi:hypothetical protein
MLAKTTSKDLGPALAVTAVGAAVIFFALHARWSPQDLDPGVEGCLTVGIVGFVMAMLHPLPYRQAVALCVPAVAAGFFTVRYAASTAIGAGMAGIQLLIMGIAGVALALREPSEAVSVRAPPSPLMGRSAHSHS